MLTLMRWRHWLLVAIGTIGLLPLPVRAAGYASPEALLDAYCAAVRKLDAKALLDMCDAESLPIGELVIGPEDAARVDAYGNIPHMPEAIQQARKVVANIRDAVPATIQAPRARVEAAIRERLRMAGDDWCKTAQGHIVSTKSFTPEDPALEGGALLLEVQFEGAEGTSALCVRATPAGWQLSYYALCEFSATLLQGMTWVRGEMAIDALDPNEKDPYAPAALAALKRPVAEDAASVKAGGEIFANKCSLCHGDTGRAESHDADYFDPRPRDFSRGLYKFRTTASGAPPADEDLFRAISRGLPGTGMPAWGEPPHVLSETERWQLVYYLKSLCPRMFGDKSSAAAKPKPELPEAADAATPVAERVKRGAALFAKSCAVCHGAGGRGDGAVGATLSDEWGDPIRPANLTKRWKYKNGSAARDVFRDITTGLNGTPMPSFQDALTADQRWDIAHYVASLQVRRTPKGQNALKVQAASAPVPLDPQDSFWDSVPAVDVRLAGQLVATPRLTFPAVDTVRLQAAADAKSLVVRLAWDDRTMDVTPTSSPPKEETWKPEIASRFGIIPIKAMWERRARPGPDSMQLQFGMFSMDQAQSVPAFLGDSDHPVTLFRWKAIGTASKWLGGGTSTPPDLMSAGCQNLESKATYDAGRWTLVVRAPLKPTDAEDYSFRHKHSIPIALQAWDGGAGEEGLLCGCSGWYELIFPGED